MFGAGDGEETMITINGAAYPLDTITPYNSEYGPFERRNRVKITYTDDRTLPSSAVDIRKVITERDARSDHH